MAAASRGFSLIELIVVVAIIAVLASLLLSGIKTVRYSARQMVCGSNLRQIGMGFTAYATDYEQRMPYVWYAPATTWGSAITDQMDDGGKGLGVWKCPENTFQGYRCSESALGEKYTSYSCNGLDEVFGSGYVYGNRYMHTLVSRMAHPSALVAVFESFWYRSQVNNSGLLSLPYSIMSGMPYVRYRHLGKANVLFADGRVEARAKVAADSTTLSNSRMWIATAP